MMAKDPEKTASAVGKQKPDHLWKKGQSGNPKGRIVGSKNRLNEDFLSALADDFEVHGKASIVTVREGDPAKYLTIVAALVPKESDLNVKADTMFANIWKAVASGTMAAMVDHLETLDDGDTIN